MNSRRVKPDKKKNLRTLAWLLTVAILAGITPAYTSYAAAGLNISAGAENSDDGEIFVEEETAEQEDDQDFRLEDVDPENSGSAFGSADGTEEGPDDTSGYGNGTEENPVYADETPDELDEGRSDAVILQEDPGEDDASEDSENEIFDRPDAEEEDVSSDSRLSISETGEAGDMACALTFVTQEGFFCAAEGECGYIDDYEWSETAVAGTAYGEQYSDCPDDYLVSPEGRAFYGWSSDGTADLVVDLKSYVPLTDTVFYAVWYTPVQDLSLDSENVSLPKGNSLTLHAAISPEDADFTELFWESSNEAVATVDDSGDIIAVGKGTAVITARTAENLETVLAASCSVTVTQPVTSITLNKSTASVVKGKTIALKVTAKPASADDKTVQWTSSNKKVATVTSKGIVKGVAKGTATITAAAADGSGKKAVCKVTVKQPVTKVKMNKTSASLFKGKTLKLKATAAPTTANNRNVKWTSSNKKVATVTSKGIVKGIKKGTVTITATAADGSGKKATCKITVKQPVTKVKLNKSTLTVSTGRTAKLKATALPTTANSKKVTWTSSNPRIATVSSTGVVKGIWKGTVTITAKAADGSGKKASCKVTVRNALEQKTFYTVQKASSGCVLASVKGTYVTQAKAALKRINAIRYEACKEKIRDPRDPSRRLSLQDYVPIKWSSSLEYIARVRAAEASLTMGHYRLNGESCFSVLAPDGSQSWEEVLAWNYSSSMMQGIEQWYAEKKDWVNNTGGVTGHYTSMIDPSNTYVGLACFLSSAGSFPNTTSGEFTSGSGYRQTMSAGVKNCTVVLDVLKTLISSD